MEDGAKVGFGAQLAGRLAMLGSTECGRLPLGAHADTCTEIRSLRATTRQMFVDSRRVCSSRFDPTSDNGAPGFNRPSNVAAGRSIQSFEGRTILSNDNDASNYHESAP